MPPQVLEILARSALALSETKSGANTLALILSLEPPGAECAACHHASSSLSCVFWLGVQMLS